MIYRIHILQSPFFVYSQICATLTSINFRTFLLPQKETPCPLAVSIPSSAQALATTNLLSTSVDLPVFKISYKQKHTTCNLCDWLL